MGDYYNTTRTPISVTLRSGGSTSIGPKTWCYLSPEDEGTSSLATSVRKGFLVRALVPITNLAVEPPAVSVVAAVDVVPLVVAMDVTPVPESAAPSVSAPEPVVAAPSVVESKSSRRNNK